MNGKRIYSIIGGDLRNVKLGELLAEDGYEVRVYGFKDIEIKNREIVKETLNEAVEGADVVIGPVPCSLDGQTLNCSYFEDKIFMNELFRLMNKNQIFIAGFINEKVKHMAEGFNIFWSDILDREEMAVLNAIPTVLPKSVQLLQSAS